MNKIKKISIKNRPTGESYPQLIHSVSDTRKPLGIWGESQLDVWFFKQGWKALVSNSKFKGGELDRLYHHHSGGYCFSEVKTLRFKSWMQFSSHWNELFSLKVLKSRQIRNLYRMAESFLMAQKLSQSNVHVRIFCILSFKEGLKEIEKECYLKFFAANALKVCSLQKKFIIVSLVPELVTGFRSSRSRIQTYRS